MKFIDSDPEIQRIVQESLGIGFPVEIEKVLMESPNYFRGISQLVGRKNIAKVAKFHATSPGMLLASFIFSGIPVEDGAILIKNCVKELEQMK